MYCITDYCPSDVNDLHDSSCDSHSDKEDEEARDARLQQELNNLNLNICAEVSVECVS